MCRSQADALQAFESFKTETEALRQRVARILSPVQQQQCCVHPRFSPDCQQHPNSDPYNEDSISMSSLRCSATASCHDAQGPAAADLPPSPRPPWRPWPPGSSSRPGWPSGLECAAMTHSTRAPLSSSPRDRPHTPGQGSHAHCSACNPGILMQAPASPPCRAGTEEMQGMKADNLP